MAATEGRRTSGGGRRSGGENGVREKTEREKGAAGYFRSVGAPAIFDFLARELLRAAPPQREVIGTLQRSLQQLAGEPEPGAFAAAAVAAGSGDRREALRRREAAAFDEMDSVLNKDGVISRDELLSVLCQERLVAKLLFKELDTNHDGRITRMEWHAWFDRVITKGSIESGEDQAAWIEDRIQHAKAGTPASPCTAPLGVEQARANEPSARVAEMRQEEAALRDRAAHAFDAIDAQCNRDGEVSRDELLRVLRQERLAAKVLFRELDENSDGGISLTEWHTWLDRVMKKGGTDEVESRLEWIEDRLHTAKQPRASKEFEIEVLTQRSSDLHLRFTNLVDLVDWRGGACGVRRPTEVRKAPRNRGTTGVRFGAEPPVVHEASPSPSPRASIRDAEGHPGQKDARKMGAGPAG